MLANGLATSSHLMFKIIWYEFTLAQVEISYDLSCFIQRCVLGNLISDSVALVTR